MQLALTHGETRANEEHRAIAAAARAGDTKRACLLVRDHIAGAGRSLLVFLRRSARRRRDSSRSSHARARREETAHDRARSQRRHRAHHACARSSAARGPRVRATQWITDRNPSNASDIVAYVPEGVADDARRAASAAADAFERVVVAHGRRRAPITSIAGASRSRTARKSWRRPSRARSESRSAKRAARSARCVAILRYYAGEAVREVGEVIPAQVAGALQFTLREPLGVVALITPWNFPLAIPLWKTAPALAFGNTVVLKPAEMSSHVATAAGGDGIGRRAPGRRVQRRARDPGAAVGEALRARTGGRGGQLHRVGTHRRHGRGHRGRAEHPLSDGDGRQERRDRAARRRHRAGRVAHGRRRDALCRAEVHGDEPRRRRARSRRTVSRRAATPGRRRWCSVR